MRIINDAVVITKEGSSFGLAYLKRLQEAGGRIPLLIVERVSWRKRIRMAKFLASKIGWIDAAAYNALMARSRWTNEPPGRQIIYEVYANDVVRTENINDDTLVHRIVAGGVFTKVILAHAGIVRSALLDTPHVRVVNAHPAILPRIRGVDVVRWSLYKLHPLGATLHYVDRGADTGRIIKKQYYTVNDEDTLSSIDASVNDIAVQLLVQATLDAELLDAPGERQDPTEGILHYLMPRHLRAQLERSFPRIKACYLRSGSFIHETHDPFLLHH